MVETKNRGKSLISFGQLVGSEVGQGDGAEDFIALDDLPSSAAAELPAPPPPVAVPPPAPRPPRPRASSGEQPAIPRTTLPEAPAVPRGRTPAPRSAATPPPQPETPPVRVAATVLPTTPGPSGGTTVARTRIDAPSPPPRPEEEDYLLATPGGGAEVQQPRSSPLEPGWPTKSDTPAAEVPLHAASPQSGAATFTLQIQELYHYLKDIFRSIAEKDYVFDFKTCHEIVAGAVDHILAIEESQLGQDRENEVVRAIFEDYEHDLLRHSISVFLICIEVGCTLRQPHEKLVKLGMASLLHDLIMYHMPERLLTHSGAFSESDRQDWRRHIREGFEHLSTVALPPWIANIVFYLVRKNLEFPVELKQRDQFEFAMIIEMANSYEAITHRRSWRTSLDSFAVVSAILKSSDVVPQYLIKALFMTFSIFAPNSYVLLNNGEVALVIGVNKNYPLRPRIRIVFDSQKHFKKVPRELDLKEHRTFTIVDPVPNDEVERWRAQGG